jgi:hypothetical protein
MSLEPSLPFEFLVRGVALSAQASSRSKDMWKQAIRAAAASALPDGYWLLTEPLTVTIFIFPRAALLGDVDNRVKPILDAMNRCVYDDDELIERVVVQKFEPGRARAFRKPSETLQSALEADEPLVYIRISDELDEGLP